ncbi:PREDICTED: uncharacterized protein LOC109234921 [Nicotiana attenuata]|uniref:uncharacterized protein LOC109234921 n=1 Tax=Nicotiana attenuata TaxID=49451 RepID=UPI000905397F|nr:PREDICTED: uncharacterized protein LOC109234921 [Nicotiana attenuata]
MENEQGLGHGSVPQQHARDQLNSGVGNSTIGTGNQPAGVDYNHPLFLSPADVSGIQIISFQLTSIENYSIWNRSTRAALLGRNKLGLIDGSCKKKKFPKILWNHRERVNAIVLSWIMNSVSKNLLGEIMYASCAQVVWEDLFERFNKVDDSRSFNLHKEIATLSQGTAFVSVYFSKLKDMWEEFEALVPAPGCDYPKYKEFVVYLQKLKMYQFLMGLNDSYAQTRSQILMRSPVPTVNQAYAMIISGEGQKSITNATGILGANPAMMSDKGHNKENCYKIVGYPPDYRPKKKGGAGTNVAYNVMTDNLVQQTYIAFNDARGSLQSVNMNINQGYEDKGSVNGLNFSQLNQMTGCTFSKEQYDQILQLLNKSGTSQSSSTISTPAASKAGISCALLVSNSLQEWIIDTGATNHMVANLNMLNKSIVVQSEKPKKIFMPNGDISYELFSRKVRVIGREDDGPYILERQAVGTSLAVTTGIKESDQSNSTTTKEVDLWHKRFGHASSTVLKKLLHSKTDLIVDTIKQCFDKIVRIIRTDNGIEFINSVWSEMFKKFRIVHQTSCAYTPQQNGVDERKHSHILEVTKAIRLQAEIPIRFWGHFVTADVYLINRLPSYIINNKTPYEKLYQNHLAISLEC